MPPLRTLAVLYLAAGCRSHPTFFTVDPSLDLDLTSPEYGEFLGDEAAVVTGRVSPARAVVTVEGEPVTVAADSTFAVVVPIEGPYQNIDVVATWGDQRVRERVPVFRGADPTETWPGGITARVLQPGLDAMGTRLGLLVDAMGWDEQLAAALPVVDQGWLVLTPTGMTHDATTVDLAGAVGGLDTGISLHGLRLLYDFDIDIAALTLSGDMAVGYDTITVRALSVPQVDEAGMLSLSLTDPHVVMSDATLQIDGLDLWMLEWLLDGVSSWVSEPLSQLIADLLASQIGTLQLGGPFALQTTLMGMALDVALDDLHGDPAGLGLDLAVGVTGLPEVDPLAIHAPLAGGIDPADAQVAIGLHEGLFQTLLTGDLLDMLSQSLELGGTFGELIGGGLRNLPGGDQAPEGNGWCLRIDPGEAKVARMQEGIAPLAELYLPDFRLTAGTLQGPNCQTWLEASLAVEAGLSVRQGTVLTFDLSVPDGILLAYGAEAGTYDEAEVVSGLGTYLETMLSLLGGSFQLDLADLFGGLAGGGGAGGPLGELHPQIIGSTQLLDENGEWIEGAFAVGMDLWSE